VVRQSSSERISSAFATIDTLYELMDSGDFGQALHVATLFLALRRLDICRGTPTAMGSTPNRVG
jgi:hypothetical protein